MERALVSLRATETHRELLTEAVDCEGADGELVVLWHLDETEYDADVATLESVGRVENTEYDHRSVVEGAGGDAREFVESTVAVGDIDARIVVSVDSETSRDQRVLDAATAHDCDHVFIVGSDRSPTGKAVFGDFAQEVILNFDGFTTVLTE